MNTSPGAASPGTLPPWSARSDPFLVDVPGGTASPRPPPPYPPQQPPPQPPPPQPQSQASQPPPAAQQGNPAPYQPPTTGTTSGPQSVANDPFLTHKKPAERAEDVRCGGDPLMIHARPPALAAGSQPTCSDPFLTRSHPAGPATAMVYNDPFLTHNRPPERMDPTSLAENPFLLTAAARRALLEQANARRYPTLTDILGPGDPKRESWVALLYTWLAWGMFMWVLLLCMVQYHFLPSFTKLFIVLLFVMCITMTIAGLVLSSLSIAALRILGGLCSLAVLSGALVGHHGWTEIGRQFWWMQTGSHYEGASPDEAASLFGDAAWIQFSKDPMATTNSSIFVNTTGNVVDHQRAAGYVSGENVFCVAPLLDEVAAGGDLVRVQFWVVGLNCCDTMGFFDCDDSRKAEADMGLVMINQDTESHLASQFRKAIEKAEVTFGLRGSTSALWLRWVEDPGAVSLWYGWRFGFYITVASFVSFLACAILGFLCNYYGFGRPDLLDEVIDAVEDGGKTENKQLSMKQA
eukprot:CAMPEP_0178431428 /NCGR_PEP_ID=MMETSP0689_2-20121128/31840_1 /TAXON_ID=160604 /ORGANISM="Amphidinium massartii, Strain CS-259" /LENGTH=520 /DNA_ID=CAMNT_0020053335 /DNA_START=79 /DNA_END=1637 /DNA_ORIENTATION=-